jgi:hypothetical protein
MQAVGAIERHLGDDLSAALHESSARLTSFRFYGCVHLGDVPGRFRRRAPADGAGRSSHNEAADLTPD